MTRSAWNEGSEIKETVKKMEVDLFEIERARKKDVKNKF